MGKIKVLYIAGSARSGSTLVSDLLGQYNGFINLGEVCYIWERGFQENWVCSCGKDFLSCPFWTDIVKEVLGEIDQKNIQRYLFLSDRGVEKNNRKRYRFRELIFKSNRVLSRKIRNESKEFLEITQRIYSRIQARTGARVLVDSSKRPAYAFFLANIPQIDLYVLHLVRDPRAVIYSQVLRKKRLVGAPGTQFMNRKGKQFFPILYTLFDYYVENFLIEKFFKEKSSHYMLMRYEDFVKKPAPYARKILDFIEETGQDIIKNGHIFYKHKNNHVFSGNPIRFDSGKITIQSDEVWKEKMKKTQKVFLSLLSFFSLGRYHYSF